MTHRSLVVTPSGEGPLTFAVKELAGISGDDYTINAKVPGGSTDLVLSLWDMTAPRSLRRCGETGCGPALMSFTWVVLARAGL